MHFSFRSVFSLCSALFLLAVHAPRAHAEPSYPVVFTSPAELIPFGILIRAADDATLVPPNFNTRCYDGDDMLSGEPEFLISDQMLADYKAKGFTRETLCMGLASRTAYDPDTGRRLPTYILRDQKRIVEHLEQQLAEARNGGSLPAFNSVDEFAAAVDAIKREDFSGYSEEQLKALLNGDRALTWERPLVVPTCYKNATPYLDCEWKVGITHGRRYTEKNTARKLAAALDRQLKDAIASGQPIINATPGAAEVVLSKNELQFGVYEGQPDAVKVPQALLDWDKAIDWIMISKGLPRGYGYAFAAFRFPDGSFTLNSVDPQKSSRKLDPQGLLDVIKSFF